MQVQILHLLEGAKEAKGLTVIIDVFRAFTVETWLTLRGAEKIIPVGDVQVAWDYKAGHPDAVLCGERKGIIIEGFDYGNSPSQIENADLRGKTVIHTTSAGTQGIANAAGADEIIGGNLVAAKAIAEYIRRKNPEYVSLVCMGLSGDRRTDEDELCGAYIKSLLEGKPLEDMPARMAALAQTDGKKFFDESRQNVFPRRDFQLCTMLNTCPFILRLVRSSDGLDYMERVDVPESVDVRPGSCITEYSAEQALAFPREVMGRIAYQPYSHPEGRFDCGIVLGGSVENMTLRAKAALELYRRGQCEKFIVTGGVERDTDSGRVTEAAWLAAALEAGGVPKAAIVLENRAATTHENYIFSRPILKELFGDRPLRLATVTNRFHLVRAVALAGAYLPEHTHLPCCACDPADTPESFWEREALRETVTKECRCLRSYASRGLIPDIRL